jgi:hypothetical protein
METLSRIASGYRQLAALSWPKSFPIAQFPNAPLIFALAGSGVAKVASSGAVHDWGQAVNEIGIAAWAWLELTDGVNWFRRLLGAGSIVWLASQIASQLGS